MKKNFLWAVAVYALCSSCETADDSFIYEEKQQTVMALKTQNVNDYETYQNIMAGFNYDGELSYEINLIRFEEHVKLVMPYYYEEAILGDVSIDWSKVSFLATVGVDFID